MTRGARRTLWLATFALVPALALARVVGPARDIPAGTGYSAWELCTRTMHSGETFDHVRARYVEPKVQPLPSIWSVALEPGGSVEVRCRVPTLSHDRTAVYRRGLGCTLAPPGTSEAELRAQPFTPAAKLPADDRPWPLGEGAARGQRLVGPLRATIGRHAEAIFGESSDELAHHQNTTALLIARDGELLYERYGQGYARQQPQLGWSMTKSLTAIIAGTLARDGRIELDAPVGLAQWRGTPKAAITWRQLLNMAPGLAWFEGYGGASDATEMLFSRADQGAWAAARPLTSTPGTVFTYSTGFSNIAMLRMRQLLGGTHQALYAHYQRELFAPLGIRGGVIEPDASGTPVGGARGLLRPVDWLRLGQLVANGGDWYGTRLLARDYVAFLTAASPASAGYGGSLWRAPADVVRGEVRSRLPPDLVFFAGHLGQFTVIVPNARLVVLRMGVTIDATMQHDSSLDRTLALVADLVDAHWPARPPTP
jgi:CubicO group peptidase (beta-lactamase class C family)